MADVPKVPEEPDMTPLIEWLRQWKPQSTDPKPEPPVDDSKDE